MEHDDDAWGGPDIELLRLLDHVLDPLEDRHHDILKRRLGLSAGDAQTLQDIGDDYGVTRERIRQLQVKALTRLRSRAKRHSQTEGSAEQQLGLLLDARFQNLDVLQGVKLIRHTFPEANADLLATVLGIYSSASKAIVTVWASDEQASARNEHNAQSRRERIDERFQDLLGSVVWTESSIEAKWVEVVPCRQVGERGGSFRSIKANRHVEFESDLERRVYQILEESPQVTTYCEQPLFIEYTWAGRTRRYFPDALVHLDDGRIVLLEVKPQLLWADGQNVAKWDAATTFCSDRGWGFAVTGGNRHPRLLLHLATSDELEILEGLTTSGPASWQAVSTLWFSAGHSWSSLLGNSLAHGFTLQRSPFSLSRVSQSPWLQGVQRLPPGTT